MKKRHQILVVDDEPRNIETIIECLKEGNYKILVAGEGKSGYQIAVETLPDLIITDWEMPEMSGIEMIKLLKRNDAVKDIPIIMETGKMLKSNDLKEALEAGAVDYVRSPIDKIELLARVHSAILLFETMKKNTELHKEIQAEKEKRLKAEIENSKKKLASISLKLIQSSKFVSSLINDLVQINKLSHHTDKEIISNLIDKYKTNSIQIGWKEFEIAFQQVHKNFYMQLNKEYPMLSKGERKLIIFLKLNMSSKDISAITFQSSAAIKKARQRLRQKMGLSYDVNLATFIQYF